MPSAPLTRDEWRAIVSRPTATFSGTHQTLNVNLEDVVRMAATLERFHEALEALLLLVDHETGLPESAANGVTDPTGTIDEGVVTSGEALEAARALLDAAAGKG